MKRSGGHSWASSAVRWTVAPQSGQARYPYTPDFLTSDVLSHLIFADPRMCVCGIRRRATVKFFTGLRPVRAVHADVEGDAHRVRAPAKGLDDRRAHHA